MPTRRKSNNLTVVPDTPADVTPLPDPPEPLTITGAADVLDYRALREATLKVLAEKVQDPETPPRDLAALSRRMLDVAGELEAMDAAEAAAKKAAREAARTRRAANGTKGDAPFSLGAI